MSEEKSIYTLGHVEDEVFRQEGVRIVFRAPSNMECQPYKWPNPLNSAAKVEHLMYRIGLSTKVGYVIVDGTANTVHPKTRTLQNLVRTYQRF